MKILLSCVLGLLFSASGSAQTAGFDPQSQVTEALAKVKAVAVNRDRLDWAKIEARARLEAAKARDPIDMLPAYQALIVYLDDNQHSFMLPPKDRLDAFVERYSGRRFLPDSPPFRRPTSAFVRRSEVEATDLPLPNGHVARHLTVPKYNGDDADASFATSIFAATVAKPQTCGFVVDVRGNTGGNMFPMVTGLTALLGADHEFALSTETGADARGVVSNGVFTAFDPQTNAGEAIARVTDWHNVPGLAASPVAVLSDDGTASSGEAVIIAFRHRPATRSFGSTTAGKASANTYLKLNDDVVLMVTSAYQKDRTGMKYVNGITPDVVIEEPATPNRDLVLDAARLWLASQPPCNTPRRKS